MATVKKEGDSLLRDANGLNFDERYTELSESLNRSQDMLNAKDGS